MNVVDEYRPIVTCLMCVYNGEEFLNESISSILNQTFKDFEFLIINDGSSDDSVQIIESFNDSRIKLIHNPKNIGLTKSLNLGLKVAKGKYIARMDADDISLPDRFEKQLSNIEQNNADLSGSAFYLIYKNQEIEKISNFSYPSIVNLFKNTSPHTSYFFKRIINNELVQYDSNFKYSQDFELYSRLILNSAKYYYSKEILVKVRINENQVSNKFRVHQELLCGEIVLRNLNNIIGFKIFTNPNEGAFIGNYYSFKTTKKFRMLVLIKLTLSSFILLFKRKFPVLISMYELWKERM